MMYLPRVSGLPFIRNFEEAYAEAQRRIDKWCLYSYNDDSVELNLTMIPHLSELPEIPNRVKNLRLSGTDIETLESLPPNLISLFCENTRLKRLPELPNTLRILFCNNTPLKTLPNIPKELYTISVPPTVYPKDIPQSKDAKQTIILLREYYDSEPNQMRITKRTLTLKEEIIAAAFHPTRIEKLLEKNTLDATLDNL